VSADVVSEAPVTEPPQPEAAAPPAVAAEAEAMEQRELKKRVAEALIFASPEPLAEKAIAERLPSGSDTGAILAELASDYAQRGIRLVKIADSWTFRTAPELAPHLQLERKVTRKLSRAALEALGIVAYHQPVTRAEIEEIRGVALSRGTLDVLLEAGWIKPGKRRRTPGRPVTWVTTQEFLDHFALEKIDDLPGLDEMKASGLLDTRPRVHVLQPGSSEEGADEGEGEGATLDELEGLEDEGAAAPDAEARDADAPDDEPDAGPAKPANDTERSR
jgi:segregation and condensation protein B